MKKRTLLLTLASLTSCAMIYANDGLPPEPNPDYPEVPFAAAVKEHGKWGAIDENGKTVIPISFDRIGLSLSAVDASDTGATDEEPDRENLIEVAKGNLRGFYHRDGREIIPPSYESRSIWKEGYLAVQDKDKKISFYRNDGTLISKNAYDQVSDFEHRMAIVKRGNSYGYLSRDGEEIAPVYQEARFFHGGLAAVKEKGKWGIIDTRGHYVVPPTYKDVKTGYDNGLLAVKGNKNLWGFLSGAGEEAIPLIYKDVSPTFSEGLAAVQNETKLWGFIDDKGNEVIRPQYKEVFTPFSEGLAGVKTIDGNAYIHTDGTTAFMADYDVLYPFHDGIAEIGKGEVRTAVVERSAPISIGIGIGFGHWLDRPGRGPGPRPGHGPGPAPAPGPAPGPAPHGSRPAPPPPPRHHHGHWGLGIGIPLWAPTYSTYETVSASMKRGYIDKTGKVIASPTNDRVFPAGKEGILISKNGDYGWVNKEGTYIAHTTYASILPDEENGVLLAKNRSNLWGILSMEDGHEILPISYKAVKSLGGGYFGYKEGNHWGIVDAEGNTIAPPAYQTLAQYGEGFLPVKDKKGWLFLAEDGAPAITPKDTFTDITPFHKGRAAAKVKGKWGLIDCEGRFVVEPVYDDVNVL